MKLCAPSPFLAELKYQSWTGLVTLDQEVFLAPDGNVALVEPLSLS